MNKYEYLMKQLPVIEVPLNVIKEKISLSLPIDTEIEDEAVIAINKALNHFLKLLAQKIPYSSDEEKKILVRDIKACVDNEQLFSFAKNLIDK